MGFSYRETCKRCGYEWEGSDGGGFSFEQWVCDRCGHGCHRPRGAPAKAKAPMRTAELRDYIAGDGGSWSEPKRPFSPAELEVINRYFAHCGCGGHFLHESDPRAKHRCPECGSDQVERGEALAEFD